MSHAGDDLAEKGKSRLRKLHTDRPATDSGRIGQPISVLELRQCLLPRTALRKALLQSLTASKQTEMRVGKREHRKESKRCPTVGAAAAMDPDPIVMLVMGLLAATSVANDRIAFTNRTQA